MITTKNIVSVIALNSFCNFPTPVPQNNAVSINTPLTNKTVVADDHTAKFPSCLITAN
ncbi:MAG: hypothetical protein H7069_09080 [Phormidesmis sp. FL-bin-119]|nr:hypothetical protein [Pedobacter sp.]